MISEIDVRDWDRAEEIIDSMNVIAPEHCEEGLLYDDYKFLINLFQQAKSNYDKAKVPAILSWWKAAKEYHGG